MSEATASAIAERDVRSRAAFHALFDALTDWIDAVGKSPEDQKVIDDLVEIVWITGLDGRGPESELLLWLAEHPEIWRRAMPEDAVIVPREWLTKILEALPPTPLGSVKVEDVELMGSAHLERHAAVAMRAREIDKQREPERIREHLIQAFTPRESKP